MVSREWESVCCSSTALHNISSEVSELKLLWRGKDDSHRPSCSAFSMQRLHNKYFLPLVIQSPAHLYMHDGRAQKCAG